MLDYKFQLLPLIEQHKYNNQPAIQTIQLALIIYNRLKQIHQQYTLQL